MHKHPLFSQPHSRKAWIVLAVFLIILLGAEILAAQVQQDFGQVAAYVLPQFPHENQAGCDG